MTQPKLKGIKKEPNSALQSSFHYHNIKPKIQNIEPIPNYDI